MVCGNQLCFKNYLINLTLSPQNMMHILIVSACILLDLTHNFFFSSALMEDMILTNGKFEKTFYLFCLWILCFLKCQFFKGRYYVKSVIELQSMCYFP